MFLSEWRATLFATLFYYFDLLECQTVFFLASQREKLPNKNVKVSNKI